MRTRRRITVVVAAFAALLIGGVAFAAWTSTGEGTAPAVAGSAQEVEVSGTQVDGLYPSGSFAGTVTVTNPNPYNVKVTAVEFDGATVDSAHAAAGCVATGGVITVDDLVTDVTIPKAGPGNSHDFGVTVKMSNDAVDACQGATFTLSYTAVAVSAA